jgi:hypothetical protein
MEARLFCYISSKRGTEGSDPRCERLLWEPTAGVADHRYTVDLLRLVLLCIWNSLLRIQTEPRDRLTSFLHSSEFSRKRVIRFLSFSVYKRISRRPQQFLLWNTFSDDRR